MDIFKCINIFIIYESNNFFSYCYLEFVCMDSYDVVVCNVVNIKWIFVVILGIFLVNFCYIY